MKLKIVSVDKTRDKYLKEGEKAYLKRLKSFARVEILELSPRVSASLSQEQSKLMQAQEVLKKIGAEEFFILLDEKGEQITSADFAQLLQGRMNMGISCFSFLIGGAFGVSDSLKERADRSISLSRFTFTYQMSRLILIEQIYRAFTILRGSPYHKD